MTYAYDDHDRLITVSDGVGTQHYAYDADSRVNSLAGPWDNDTISYRYDDVDRLVGLQLSGAEGLTYSYDTYGRLAGIANGSRSFTYGYPAASASSIPATLQRPNGSVTTFQKDLLNREVSTTTTNSSQQLIVSNTFTYDAQDQRGTESIVNGVAIPVLADSLTTYDYNKVNQQLASANPGRTYNYDADGNLTSGFTPDGYLFSATYDGENRLKTIRYTDSGSVVHTTQYDYSADSFLTRMTIDGVETKFVRSGYTLLQERDGANLVKRATTWDPLVPGGIGGLLEITQGGQRYYPLYDGKGNVTTLLDANQSVAASYAYDPFGVPVAKSGVVEQPYRFSTKMYDEKTGLSYFGYRYYLPLLGRWLNRDPLGEAGGVNLYAYVGNNPLNMIDPVGLAMNVSGGVQVGAHMGIVGISGSVQSAMGIGSGSQYCSVQTVCIRIGPGFFAGAGGVYGGGWSSGSTSDIGGLSYGAGFDFGTGMAIGAQATGSRSSLGIGVGHGGGGAGFSVGFDVCYTFTTCTCR